MLHLKHNLHRLACLIAIMAMGSTICAQTQTKTNAQTNAQTKYKITGQVIDLQEYMPVQKATVQLFTSDSTFLRGTVTTDNGDFTLYADRKGQYKLTVSSLGYESLTVPVNVKGRSTQLGTLRVKGDTLQIAELQVTGNLPKVQVVEDTVIYNADAYKMAAGSVLDELIERLPGAEVTDDGITINGKTVQKILLDGKEFFVGDMNTACKNIPVDIVDKLKLYDEKSDMARMTGIDDGNDHPVLDVRVKKGMNIGYMVNTDLGYGTHDRFAERLTATSFTSRSKLALVGNASNAGMGAGRGRGGGGSGGLRTPEQLGLNYNYDDRGQHGRRQPRLQIDGSVQWNHSDNNSETTSKSENWEKVDARTYSNSKSQNLSRSNGWNANMRLEWRPNEQTTLQFRPTWSYTTSDSRSTSTSAQFSRDPDSYTDDPLNMPASFLDDDSIRTNRRENQSISHSTSKTIGGSLQLNRKFGTMGRNLHINLNANHSSSESQSLTDNMVHLYKVRDRFGNDSTYYTNRYNTAPSTSSSYSVRLSYSEPIMKATFLQLTYGLSFSDRESDRRTYDFSTLGSLFGQGVTPDYNAFDAYLSPLGDYEQYESQLLSRYGRDKNLQHDLQLQFRIIRNHYNFSVGAQWQRERSHFTQQYRNVHTDTVRTTTNFSPTLNLYIRFTKRHTLKLDYHGNSSQPAITDLLDITDDSNPLNITKGNPGLKSSFTNNLSLEWKNYLAATSTSLSANWRFSTTSNSVSQMVTYDEKTGGRTTQKQNINGNWNTSGDITVSTALDSRKMWNISTHTTVNHQNHVSYLTVDRTSSSQKNTTRNTTWSERLTGSFRNDWLSVELRGSVSYSHVRNLLQSSADRDTWQFSYGPTINIELPWKMQLQTSIQQSSRRGYSDATANTNELIWNAQLTQSFFRKKQLQVALNIYDILGQQKPFRYNVGATSLSEQHYNSVTQYAMLHVIFHFRSFGGKAARDARRQRGPEGFGRGPGDDRERPDFNEHFDHEKTDFRDAGGPDGPRRR